MIDTSDGRVCLILTWAVVLIEVTEQTTIVLDVRVDEPWLAVTVNTVGDGDVIFTPNDTISAQNRTNASWAAIRGAHKISKKTNQGTKGNTSGLLHRRSYADVAAASA